MEALTDDVIIARLGGLVGVAMALSDQLAEITKGAGGDPNQDLLVTSSRLLLSNIESKKSMLEQKQ